MTVVDVGLNFLVNRSDSDAVLKMAYGAVGTGTNTPQASDEALQTEVLRVALTVSTNPSTGKKHWEFIVDFSECNDLTLTEVAIFDQAEEGTMLLRKLLDSAVVKASDMKLTIIVEATVARV